MTFDSSFKCEKSASRTNPGLDRAAMNSRRFRVPILSAAAPLAFCGSLAISNALYADDGGQAAADFTCALAKEKGKSRLAIFPFTDAKDEETADTHKTTTRVMGAVLK
ncbi:MAG: hypothetical protein HY042_01420, partial [Spirochaetia bacterium]|nr:hypothetical protein [Spirochaetia bacterium]